VDGSNEGECPEYIGGYGSSCKEKLAVVARKKVFRTLQLQGDWKSFRETRVAFSGNDGQIDFTPVM
jgi:hypothetical protein